MLHDRTICAATIPNIRACAALHPPLALCIAESLFTVGFVHVPCKGHPWQVVPNIRFPNHRWLDSK